MQKTYVFCVGVPQGTTPTFGNVLEKTKKKLRCLKYCPNFAACKRRKTSRIVMGKKSKTYNPGPRVNLVVLSKRQEELAKKQEAIVKQREEFAQKYEKLSRNVEHWQQLLHSANEENSRHIEHLSNFVRHDMKNAIQGLDGIIYNAAEEGSVNADTLAQLKTAVSLLRSSLDNFAKIIPSSREQTTTISDILVAVETLSRYNIQQGKVKCAFVYDRESTVRIQYPFQTIVQIVNNFVINALNAFGGQSERRLLVEGLTEGESCRIVIHDNAPAIPEADRQRIFEYGYSTTGGTGIGLFHAKSQMDEIGGTITLSESDEEGYTKRFVIEFPIQKQVQNEQIDSDN